MEGTESVEIVFVTLMDEWMWNGRGGYKP